MSQEFRIEQFDEFNGDDWWTWAVWIEGRDEALNKIEYVEWILHPTFTQPIRKIYNRTDKFRLVTGGWGEFQIHARIRMKHGDDIRLRHNLLLHEPKAIGT